MATLPDAAAAAALAADVRRYVTFCWLDILDEQLRVTNSPYGVTFSATGDEDLDGHTFDPVDARLVRVGPIHATERGIDTVTLELSGLAGIDGETMNAIGNKANWQGRTARLWRMMRTPDTLAPIGAVWSYYTGYMSVPKIVGDRTSQVIQLDVESYLGFFTAASNRTYLDQASFDPGDHSAELAIAIANGAGKPS